MNEEPAFEDSLQSGLIIEAVSFPNEVSKFVENFVFVVVRETLQVFDPCQNVLQAALVFKKVRQKASCTQPCIRFP